MSKTNSKNGNRIWDAFVYLSNVVNGGGVNFASTGAIAIKAGMSKPTVTKYMTMAQASGSVRKEKITGGYVLWIREVA